MFGRGRKKMNLKGTSSDFHKNTKISLFQSTYSDEWSASSRYDHKAVYISCLCCCDRGDTNHPKQQVQYCHFTCVMSGFRWKLWRVSKYLFRWTHLKFAQNSALFYEFFLQIILSSTVHINKGDQHEAFIPWLGDGLLLKRGNLLWLENCVILVFTSAFIFTLTLYICMHLWVFNSVFYDLHNIFQICENGASHRIQKGFITENYVQKKSYKNGSRKFRRVFHRVSVPLKSSMSESCHFATPTLPCDKLYYM